MKKKLDIKSVINEDKLRDYLTVLGVEEEHPKLLSGLLNEIESRAKELTKIKRNRNRIKANDNAKMHVSAESILSEEDISALPSWVRREIKDSVIIGNSGDVIQVPDGRKYHRKNKLNDLPGGQWTFFLNSVINTRFPTVGKESYAHELRKAHPSPKPPQLMRDIIEFFTKENEIVLDYFMGVGGTLIGASLCGRKAIGIDLNKKYIDVYKLANEALGLKEQITVVGDSINLLSEGEMIRNLLKKKKVSLILIDPPYGDMLAREKQVKPSGKMKTPRRLHSQTYLPIWATWKSKSFSLSLKNQLKTLYNS